MFNSKGENMKENSIVDVASELRLAQLELSGAETAEAELRAELRPLVEQKVEVEMNGKKLMPQRERQLSVLRGKLDEALEILEAKRGRVRQLHLLSVNKDIAAARERQRDFIAKVLVESARILPLLRTLLSIRQRISEIEDAEYLFIRGINRQLGLEGRDRLQERLRFNLGGILPPFMDVEVWAEYAERDCKGLADF
jgi:hypothetical protein